MFTSHLELNIQKRSLDFSSPNCCSQVFPILINSMAIHPFVHSKNLSSLIPLFHPCYYTLAKLISSVFQISPKPSHFHHLSLSLSYRHFLPELLPQISNQSPGYFSPISSLTGFLDDPQGHQAHSFAFTVPMAWNAPTPRYSHDLHFTLVRFLLKCLLRGVVLDHPKKSNSHIPLLSS